MCGITGWATIDAHAPAEEGAAELVRSMCARMVHRGPDSEGVMTAQGVALGMRRLAIIDGILRVTILSCRFLRQPETTS